MSKNCSSDREKLLKFEAEGREFSKFSHNFGNKIPFLFHILVGFRVVEYKNDKKNSVKITITGQHWKSAQIGIKNDQDLCNCLVTKLNLFRTSTVPIQWD